MALLLSHLHEVLVQVDLTFMQMDGILMHRDVTFVQVDGMPVHRDVTFVQVDMNLLQMNPCPVGIWGQATRIMIKIENWVESTGSSLK